LFSSATVSNNTAVGQSALNDCTIGAFNTVVGQAAMYFQTTAVQNTAVGENALHLITTGGFNSTIGYQGLGKLLTGSNNICIGYQAGYNYTGGETNNICIGANIGGNAGESNVTRISGIFQNSSGASQVYVNSDNVLGTSTSSIRFKENITDMPDLTKQLMSLHAVNFNYKEDKNKELQFGLIAEEVDKIFPHLVAYDKDNQPYSVRYEMLSILLLNVFQKNRNLIKQKN